MRKTKLIYSTNTLQDASLKDERSVKIASLTTCMQVHGLTERNYLRNQCVDERILLRWILEIKFVTMWTASIWLRIVPVFVNTVMYLWFPSGAGIFGW
jgi:hypothetical protein